MIRRFTLITLLIIFSGIVLSGCCCCALTEDQTFFGSGLDFLTARKIKIIGTGQTTTREYEYSGFNAVAISDEFNANINQGPNFSVVVQTDESMMPYIEVTKSGSTLCIGIREEDYSISNIKQMQVEITMPELTGLRLTGTSSANIHGFSSSGILELKISGSSTLHGQDVTTGYGRISLSGASNVKLTGFNYERDLDVSVSGASHLRGEIQSGDTRFNVSGTSHVIVNGSGLDLVVDASSASIVDLSDFQVYNVSIDSSGASNVSVAPSDKLNVEASGASNVFYAGSPRMAEIDLDQSSNLLKK